MNLSNSPGAIRSRRFRDNLKRARGDVANSNAPAAPVAAAPRNTAAPPTFADGTGSYAISSLPPAPPPPPPRPPPEPFALHQTSPVKMHEDKPFAAPVWVLLDGSATAAQATPEAPAEPIVAPEPPPPAPPPPQTSQAEAAAMAKLVRMYVEFGMRMIVTKRAEDVAALAPPGSPLHAVLQHANVVFDFVEQSAQNVALKYNLRVPYQDELVVAIAVGVASWGVAMKPGDAKRAAEAKNANPNEEPLGDAPAQKAAAS